MGKLFKIILGVILVYIGGKMVYNNVKGKKDEEFNFNDFKDLKAIKDIEF
jgi:putative Mn2+ efflux pump MntP